MLVGTKTKKEEYEDGLNGWMWRGGANAGDLSLFPRPVNSAVSSSILWIFRLTSSDITRNLQLGGTEVLRGFRHFSSKDKPEHHIATV